jgi:hypothetical protein
MVRDNRIKDGFRRTPITVYRRCRPPYASER